MKLRFTSLGSGSKGNCTVVQHGRTTILVDCGFSRTRTIEKLRSRGVLPEDVDAILVTHEHSDHISGVRLFANHFDVPVFATYGTFSAIDKLANRLINEVVAGASIEIGDLQVHSVPVPHDAREPTQFIFDNHSVRLGILTDIGVITDHVVEQYSRCNALFVESNHDIDMLWSGNDPQYLKSRVSSDGGHLSNDQAREFIDKVLHERMTTIAIGHISQRNNSVSVLQRQYADLIRSRKVEFATQEHGTSWQLAE